MCDCLFNVPLTFATGGERNIGLLQQADTISDYKPDSALLMLKSVFRDSFPNGGLGYYHDLQIIKTDDKAYIIHASDSSILSVIAYYEQHPNDSLLPVAIYFINPHYKQKFGLRTRLQL